MSGAIRVLLPPPFAHLAPRVQQAGCVPVIDATTGAVPDVPDGAWVRTRPGHPAPGNGPVILAELGAPVPDRPTWLESAAPRATPRGYAGLVLKGREAAGLCGDRDGLEMLAACPEPDKVILEAGVGPHGAGAAAALGAAGVLLSDTWLGCPEVSLPADLAHRLDLPADEITRVVAGLRVGNPATSPVLRRLVAGEGPWELIDSVWTEGDLSRRLWFAGQGLALARGLADRYGTLEGLLRAYAQHWVGWQDFARRAVAVDEAVPVHTSDALAEVGTAASTGGPVGSGVLWEMATWLGRPVHGGPARAAAAIGAPVVGDAKRLADALSDLPPMEAKAEAPALEVPAAPAPAVPTPAEPAKRTSAAAVAVVGIGCRFPGANSTQEYWDNIVNGVSAITEVPPDRWDPDLYFDADQGTPDKSYTKIGAFLEDFQFDSKRFRIPPKVAKQIDPVQQITLACVADALDDAGLKVDRRHDGREFDRERCAVILGNSLGGEMSDAYAIRLHWHAVDQKLAHSATRSGMDPTQLQALRADVKDAYLADLPVINEDSMPGELANVIAGRIANAFDLGGANFTVDAACASSMAALQSSVKTLQDGDADLVVTGGADRSMNIATYVKFCKIGALSPDHSAPFDASANGFVMGEGCGILILKRYEDAVRDGDRIYSVIRGIGASSDGKGKGITAPNIKGQIRALERAYEAAGIEAKDLDLIECHGTSTVVGDKVEVEALSEVIGPRGDRGPVRIGSVKSMIGHLKSAAGAASCIKASLALYHGVYPPSLGFEKAREDVPLDAVPLKVQTSAESWPEPEQGPRRCGVSAFGFGGTNFHIVLEGFTGQELPKAIKLDPPTPQPDAPARPAAPVATPAPAPAPLPKAPPAAPAVTSPDLPEGIWATSGVDRDEILANLRELAAGRPAPFHANAPVRIAAASRDAEEREGQLARAIKAIDKGTNPDMLRARAIHFEEQPFDGKLALLFTGQGSQYLDMGLDLAEAYPQVADTFAQADSILAPTLGKPITDFIRLREGEDKSAKSDTLRQTEYSQPATLTLDIAILRLLASYGVSPDLVAGHSLGEYGAAVAAGVMTFEQALYAVSARGREMANIRLDDPGKMAGIAASPQAVEGVLAEIDGYVIAANKNCPTQTVIAGASDAVEEASERFKARGTTVYPLPVSHAFHSAIVAPASDPLRGVLGKLGLKPPRRPITTNVTGEYYPTGDGAVEQIIDLLAQQISAPVEWVAQMERMYGDGARVFVEVGPKRALSGFTVSILKRRPHRALYTNHPKRGGIASFRDSLAGLLCYGFPIRPEPVALDSVDLFAPAEPRLATTDAVEAFSTDLRPAETHGEALPDIREGVLQIVADSTGYETDELDLDYELEADLGIDTVKQAEVFSTVRTTWNLPEDEDFDFSANRTLRSVIDWVAEATGGRRIVASAAAAPTPAPTPAPAAPPAPASSAPGTALIDDGAVARFLTEAAKAGVQTDNGEQFARALLPAVQGLLSAAFQAALDARPPAPAAVVPDPVVPASSATAATAPATTLPGSLRPADLGVSVVCSGAAVGLPGGEAVFDDQALIDILGGNNRISHIGERAEAFLEKGLVRLVKDSKSGQGSFLPVTEVDQVIRLAGIRSHFDISEWGVPESYARALDITTRLAFAAGLQALRDAGIPLVRVYKTSASGKQVPQGWQLPEGLRDGTGVIFASAFPGYDALVDKFANNGDDGEGRFDRRFLFQVLSMGHSQFAQFIGARGPNTAVNAACASTTQALSIAEDWIRLGRAERVIVVGADDVTSEQLLPWIGSGFMAAGAATTKDKVEEAALPFDRRRHGMILGMGAVGMVLERAELAERRGVVPVAELAGSMIVNSAFHGTRLDIDHISGSVRKLVGQVASRTGTTPAEIARNGFFVSHETYTPARGGSSAAEIAALRAAFGEDASQIAITNTKGYTGHAMGAGIEDAVAVKGLQYGLVPPVANLEEPDPDLGELTLSPGLQGDYRWCVRLAAGFGSQLAVAVWRKVASGDARVRDDRARAAWLREVTGFSHVAERIDHRTLRVEEADQDALLPLRPERSPASEVRFAGAPTQAPAPAPRPAPVPAAPKAEVVPLKAGSGSSNPDSVLAELTAVIAEKTGYEPDELESDYELEADLGIDTVKQAEIVSELTERYGLEPDDDFSMADYPTIESLAFYLSGVIALDNGTVDLPPERVSGPSSAPSAPVPPTWAPEADPGASALDAPPAPTLAPAPAPAPAPAEVDEPALPAGEGSLDDLIAVVAEKTGYEPDELEPDFELEADLGVDTVKQAEIISALQDRYSLPPDDDFSLADHPTLGDLASYLDGRRALVGGAAAAPVPSPEAAAPADDAERAPNVQPSTGRAFVAEEFDLRPALTDEEVAQAESPPLPESFRIRRPVLVDKPAEADGSIEGFRVRVLGDGTVADALREELERRGARFEAPHDTVIDLADDVKQSFALARELEGQRPARWLTLTRLGDFRGIFSLERAHVDGSRAGFTKALGREWAETTAKALDLPTSVRPADVARVVCDELTGPGDAEVFVKEGVRKVIGYQVEDRPRALVPETPLVALITGGGRGICAQVANALARRADVTFALVGRSPAGTAVLDEKAEKKRIKEALKAAGERATPAKVEKQLAPLRKADEIRATLQTLRDLGRTAEYFVCDTASADAVRALVEEVEAKLGAIGLCIHGAGAEESRLIADKDDTAFHRVYDGKSVGGATLVEVLPDACFFVSMGSVAGRFGNPGQVDYAAANDSLARICLTRPHSLHVDWTAWDDVGMAARGGMKHLLTERGVDMLPADVGASLLVDLVAAQVEGEIVVAGALGDFLPAPEHPLLDKVEHDGDLVRATHQLSLATDPWIVDHSIEGVPVLPGVIGLEMMAATAGLAMPERRLNGARNVRFNAPVKVHGDQTTELIVEARPTPRGDEVRARLVSVRTLRTGRVKTTEHFSATLVFGEDAPPDGLPSAFLPDEPIDAEQIYRRFFHGPRFQVLTQVFGVSADGLVAEARVDHDGLMPGLQTSPLALESAFQAAGLHRMITAHQMGLPMEIDELSLMGAPRDGEIFSLTVQQVGEAYDVDVDGTGGPLMRLRGFSLVNRGPLPDGDRWPEPEGGRPTCFPEATASTRAGGRTTAEARADEDPRAWLTEPELAVLRARGTERRVRDRVAGRIAAKRALHALTGVDPLLIRVPSADSGQPIARVPGREGLSVSISHREGRAVAVAVDAGRVGIDLEGVERRPAHFAETWFTPVERELAGEDLVRQTVLWAVKEAVLKALGTGFALSPNTVRVVALDHERAEVQLAEGAEARWRELGGAPLEIRWVAADSEVTVEARLAA